jgi:uncharacterized protein
MSNDSAIIQNFVSVVQDFYQERLAKIILFGSFARGDNHSESDIDFLVLLKEDNVKTSQEIWAMRKIVAEVSLSYSIIVSVFPTSLSRYQSKASLFLRNISQEGVLVYE